MIMFDLHADPGSAPILAVDCRTWGAHMAAGCRRFANQIGLDSQELRCSAEAASLRRSRLQQRRPCWSAKSVTFFGNVCEILGGFLAVG
jgi:hypothetical protein